MKRLKRSILVAKRKAGLASPASGPAALRSACAFIPLDETKGFESVLEDHFAGEKWGGHCYRGIDEETADFIDNLLNRSYTARLLRVDRDRLAECEEAWVHVIVEPDPCEDWPTWSIGGRGILTWNNSD